MAESGKPVTSYYRNVVVFGRVGVGAPVANALIRKRIFDETFSEAPVYNVPAKNKCETEKIGNVVYKIQLIDTYAQGKSTVNSAADVRRIEALCTRRLSEGINLIVFALSHEDLEAQEVAAFVTVIENMQKSAVEEAATVLLRVHPKGMKKNKKEEIERNYRESDKTRKLASVVKKFHAITIAENDENPETAEKYKKTYEESAALLMSLIDTSKEMWHASELFQAKPVEQPPKQDHSPQLQKSSWMSSLFGKK